MEAEKYQDMSLKLATLIHALSHPARVQIILHLAKYKGCMAGSISDKLPLAKSTVSEHLSKLREVGLIKSLANGNCIHYTLDDEKFGSIIGLFNDFLAAIGQSQGNRTECCASSKDESIKCNRAYEMCKTLPCFTENCYPSQS
jgi:DNA-binding transcriptional ArsR family regulator